jgi:hypothetical protein
LNSLLVSNLNYLGCNATYKYDKDLNDKLSKFQNICGAIARLTKDENQERKNSKFLQNYKILELTKIYGYLTHRYFNNNIVLVNGTNYEHSFTD